MHQVNITWRQACFHNLAVFAVLFTIYYLTAPRTVALEDDGLFILAGYFNGLAHPPGYPLYTWLSHLFTQIPIGSVALRVHMLSALFGASTGIALWWCIVVFTNNRIAAFGAAIAYGLSDIFWSQSIIAEVYTLNTFFFFLLFAWLATLNEKNLHLTTIISIGLLYGLAFTNHWPLLVLSTPALLAMVWPLRRKLLGRLPLLLVVMVIGLFPYAWLFFHAQTDPLMVYPVPLNSWGDLFTYVSREHYAGTDTSPSAGWPDKWNFLQFFGKSLVTQFSIAALTLVVIGCLYQHRFLAAHQIVALMLAFFGTSVCLILLLNFDFDHLHQMLFRVYLLIPYGVMSIWLGIGLHQCGTWLGKIGGVKSGGNLIKLALSILVALSCFFQNLAVNDRHLYRWGEDYARFVLKSLEKDAVLFLSADTDVATIGYINLIEKVRPDVTLMSNFNAPFVYPVFYPYLSRMGVRLSSEDFVEQSDRPVYHINQLSYRYGSQDYGFFKKVDKILIEGSRQMVLNRNTLLFVELIYDQNIHSDPMTLLHRTLLLEHAVIPLTYWALFDPDDEKRRVYKWNLDQASFSYEGKLRMVEQLLFYGREEDSSKIIRLLKEAELLSEEAIFKSARAYLFYLRGLLETRRGNHSAAAENFQRAIQIWPHPKNPANQKT